MKFLRRFSKEHIDIDKIMENIDKKHIIKRYVILILSLLLSALSFNLFFYSTKIVTGGISGLSIILDTLTNIDPSLFMLIVNIILLILSYFLLGFSKTIKSLIGAIVFPLFVSLTEPLIQYIDIDGADLLIKTLFGSITSGVASGFIFKVGFSSGGTDILNLIVSKIFKMGLGKSMLFTDGLIILGGICTFGVSKIMYSIINLYIVSMMTDKVMIGVSQSKSFFIITSKEPEIKKFILGQLGHGVTVLEGNGAFSGNKQKVLMCVIPTREYFVTKEGIHEIDPNAFFVVADAYEVHGNK